MPVIGWAWWFGEFLFLQRDLIKDKYTIETKLKTLFEYENPVTVFFTINKNVYYSYYDNILKFVFQNVPADVTICRRYQIYKRKTRSQH